MGGFDVHQLVLTRFSIRTPGVGRLEPHTREWLERRLELFDRYCAPSVAVQTEWRFDWLVFCDPDTPRDVTERLRATDPRVRVVTVPVCEDRRRVPDALHARHYARPGADVVISTRLDSDDVLAEHAIERVRGLAGSFHASGAGRLLHNPRLGYKLQALTGRVYEARMHNSPFLSLLERDAAFGALSSSHTHMHLRYPVFQDDTDRFWLQVIHGGNVSNHVTAADEPIDARELPDRFGLVSLQLRTEPAPAPLTRTTR
jgi:hypothetical protein